MINIKADRKDSKIVYLSISGHANYDTIGKDIVCAAISAISVGGINALSNPENFNLKVEKGDVEISQKSEANEHDYQVLDTILVQLKSVEEAYPKLVKIVEKGN